jgi:protein SCO1/2
MNDSRPFRSTVTRVLALVFVVALLGTACSSEGSTPTLAAFDDAVGQELPRSDLLGSYVGDIELPDVSNGGEPFRLAASPGGALVVYFGFTSCPDVCPTTLSDLKAALGDMEDMADRVDVAMVTIDPDRDFDATLEAYVTAFVPDGHPLRTDDDVELRAAADAFGADYSVIKTDDEPNVLHTAYLYAVDDAGEVAVVWPFGAEPSDIRSGLEDLLAS